MIAEIFSQYATKHDLELLKARLRSEIGSLRSDMIGMKADLTWRFIALTAFLGTVLSLINILLA